MDDHSAAERPEPPQQQDGEQEHQDEQSDGHKGPIRLEGGYRTEDSGCNGSNNICNFNIEVIN